MKMSQAINRRQFVQLSTLAVGATALVGRASAESVSLPVLPALPYSFAALEPHIDSRTMEIHHGKHHAAYVAGLTKALEGQADLAKLSMEDLLAKLGSLSDSGLQTSLRNHGGGHWNHSMFWQLLAPANESGKPSAKLSDAIQSSFGSMDAFKSGFADAAAKRFGSGWAWLVVNQGTLKITSTANQDNPLMKGIVPDSDLGVPVLGLDVWEHAYYLHYQNRRADYISAWWNVVNWEEVSRRFEKVKA